ncbi:MAG: hypothetical protein QM691_05940 [Opitutaceae bacterium]
MADAGTENLEVSLVLLRAQQLARRGRLREAMAVLAPGGVPPATPLLLQAYAALATGAGDYRTALPVWRQLYQQDPANAEARRMIYVIELWSRRAPWMQWFWPAVITAGVALVAAVLLLLL